MVQLLLEVCLVSNQRVLAYLSLVKTPPPPLLCGAAPDLTYSLVLQRNWKQLSEFDKNWISNPRPNYMAPWVYSAESVKPMEYQEMGTGWLGPIVDSLEMFDDPFPIDHLT